MVSVGAAIHNMLLSAHSLGIGSGLTSGQAMHSPRIRQLFSLSEGEEAVCFINSNAFALMESGGAPVH
jgi:nitroreductase